MQKSARTNPPSCRPRPSQTSALEDKGQKDEPFWSQALGHDRRSLARLRQADQKR